VAGSVRLSDEEAWDVLAATHTGVFTSLRRDGRPIALPVWFAVLDRRIYISGPASAKKVSRVRHDPRVSFLVETGEHWVDLVGVHVSGDASVVDDGDRLARVARALDEKYAPFRMDRHAMPEATRKHYGAPTATIEIVPSGRILSWQNSRLFA
jgi:PPOX class probable F420-dependent enzyme